MQSSQSKTVTLAEIAKKMNVSCTTVHKALNDIPGIGEETRDRVRKIAASLGYRPNLIARSLRSKKTNMIGVLVSFDFERRWYASLADRLIGEFRKQGYAVLLSTADPNDPDGERKSAETLMGGQVEGVVIGPVWRKSRLQPYQDIINYGVPTVFFGSSEELPVSSVDVDYVDGMRQIVEHLIAMGHSKIGYICGHDEPAVANTRAYGLQKAMLEAGLRLRPEDVLKGRGTYQSGYETMQEFIRLHNRGDLPTVVFCHSDVSAIGAMKAAKDSGLSVPKDISVVGYDGIQEAMYTDPGLTTVGDSLDMLAKRMAEILLDRINGNSQTIREYIKPKLIVRQSVANMSKQ
jgi:DNA-binding LacI/PurR family transcriptional regulator